MPRGHPDWGRYDTFSGAVVVDFAAEVAARLGSPQAISREGFVTWLDDFREGLHAWNTAGSAGGAAVNLATARSIYSPYNAELSIPATAGDEAHMRANVSIPLTPRVGLNVVMRRDTEIDELVGDIITHHPTRSYYGGFRVVPGANIQLRTGAATWADAVPALPSTLGLINEWHWLKLVVDWENGKYLRLETPSGRVNLTGPTLPTAALEPVPHLHIDLRSRYLAVAGTKLVYIGAVIATFDEPA